MSDTYPTISDVLRHLNDERNSKIEEFEVSGEEIDMNRPRDEWKGGKC